MKGKALSVVLFVFGFLIAAMAFQSADLVWAAIPLILYLLTGFVLTPLKSPPLTVQRRPVLTLAGNRFVIEMELILRNQGRRRLYFLMEDVQPAGACLEAGSLVQALSLGAEEEMSATYSLGVTRGQYNWKTVSVTVSDPFGLTGARWNLKAEGQVCAELPIRRYRPLPLHPYQTLTSPGSVPTRYGGSGVDYWGTRDYQTGDPLKRLDWRHSNRRPHQFFTKDFVVEKTACLALVLDARGSIEVKCGEDSLFDHCVQAVGSLAEVFLKQGHRVSLFVHGDESVPVFPDFGKKQLHRILRRLAEIRPESNTRHSTLAHLSLPTLTRKTFLIIVSPLLSEDHQLFVRLLALGYQTLLICPDSLDFAVSGRVAREGEEGFPLRAARLERNLQRSLVEQLSVPVIDWRVSEPLQGLLRQALRHVSRWRRA